MLPQSSGCSSEGAIPFGAPVPIYQPEPEYTDEARQAKWQGSVVLSLEVDKTGKPVPGCIRVLRSPGLGLDGKAIDAVERWRFKPGMKDGRPTSIRTSLEVDFRLQ
jgi:TonB family protein